MRVKLMTATAVTEKKWEGHPQGVHLRPFDLKKDVTSGVGRGGAYKAVEKFRNELMADKK